MKPKVLIVDHQNLFRKGLSLLLSKEDYDVVGDVSNTKEMTHVLQTTLPDVVLIDLQIPQMNGYTALSYLKDNLPDVKCMALSTFEEEISMSRALDCGAHCYLSKDTMIEEILTAIKNLLNEGYYFTTAVNKMMLSRRSKRRNSFTGNGSAYVNLGEKEITIIQMMAKGLNTMEIAAKIHLSPRTVEGIRLHLLNKTQAKNAIELVLYGVKSGLIEF